MNPLLVTFSPLILNQVGELNRIEVSKLGFDSVFIKPNMNVSMKLSNDFFRKRKSKNCLGCRCYSSPVQIAAKYNIPTVFYAEHGESEYGGLVLDENSEMKRDLREVIEHQIGDYPENWVSDNISLKDLEPYIYPAENELKAKNITAYYFSYFFRWSMLENFKYVKSKMPSFNCHPKGRVEGTFTDFDSLDDKIDCLYYYMQYIKFGFW